jgi:hypothetical protein
MGLTLHGYDEFVSNNFSNLKTPKIESINSNFDIDNYIPNIVLSQIFNYKFKDEIYPLLFGLLRKVRLITSSYNSFSAKLQQFSITKRSLNLYFDILNEIENTLLVCGQIIDLLKNIVGKDYFDKNDGSPEERIYNLHNQVKHSVEELKKNSQLQVLKLDDSGIYTTKYRVEYSELHDFIIRQNELIQKILTKK